MPYGVCQGFAPLQTPGLDRAGTGMHFREDKELEDNCRIRVEEQVRYKPRPNVCAWRSTQMKPLSAVHTISAPPRLFTTRICDVNGDFRPHQIKIGILQERLLGQAFHVCKLRSAVVAYQFVKDFPDVGQDLR
eukprot:TRINITY_DN1839_c0_g1_i1.p1 TRINITY_DN1839_c0_g1~~TRINITY_DN1839_c0_g1_i1.p1  ORF type:complete len:133 (+),score=0.43 TRINITY_DN1839_c0_g1_i1:423-821(+)